MRHATPEQKAKAAERRAKMRRVAQQISKMSLDERMQLVSDWPTTIEGHRLSLFNACMIMLQGGGSVVGGFRQWLKAGRVVRKGEHGAAIWFPLGKDKAEDVDEREITEGGEGESLRFGLATVFDISQTEAKESEAAA